MILSRMRALTALVILSCLPGVASATSRVVRYPHQVPSAAQESAADRFERVAIGTFGRDVLGVGGTFANLAVVPNGGMTVAVQLASGSYGDGVVYQVGADDPNPLPLNAVGGLAADTTPIERIGLQTGSVGGIGPMTAPSSGSSVVDLVETQVLTQDAAASSVLFQQPGGGSITAPFSTLRSDVPVYQVVAGQPAANPQPPPADAGWLGVATVTIPSGTTAITSSMIAMRPSLGAFVQTGTTPTLVGATFTGIGGAGCLQVNGAGSLLSLPCTSGLGSIAATFPITANTSNGQAMIACPTCVTSVRSGTGTTSTGGTMPQIALAHGDYAGLTGNNALTGAQAVTGAGGTTTINPAFSDTPPRFQLDHTASGSNGFRFTIDVFGQQNAADILRFLALQNGGTEYQAASVDSSGNWRNRLGAGFATVTNAPASCLGAGGSLEGRNDGNATPTSTVYQCVAGATLPLVGLDANNLLTLPTSSAFAIGSTSIGATSASVNGDVTSIGTMHAYGYDTHVPNGPNSAYYSNSANVVGPLSAIHATFTGNGTSGAGQLTLFDTSNGTTPHKTLRANGSTGAFEVVNDAQTAVLLSVGDAGALGVAGGAKFGGAVNLAGYPIANASALTGDPAFQGSGTNGLGQFTLQDTSNTQNPSTKHFRANGATGRYEITNSAGNAVIYSLDDNGNAYVVGTLYGANASFSNGLTVTNQVSTGTVASQRGDFALGGLFGSTSTTNEGLQDDGNGGWKTWCAQGAGYCDRWFSGVPGTSGSTQIMQIDSSGNLSTTTGTLRASSRRALKEHIAPLTCAQAVGYLRRTDFAHFDYRADRAHEPHIGFIADDSDAALAGPRHAYMDVNATAAVAGKAAACEADANDALTRRIDAQARDLATLAKLVSDHDAEPRASLAPRSAWFAWVARLFHA